MLKPVDEKKENENKQQAIQYIYKNIEDKLKERLSRKVAISSKGKKGAGKIEIEFYSNEDLDRLIELLSEIKAQ
jgi:ParB family chromosome partitioning protein